MGQLKLSRVTGNGEYHTLAGAGIVIDLLHQAVAEVNADPSEVVLRFKDGSLGARMDVMYPTPHTYLFESIRIEDSNLIFNLGRSNWKCKNEHSIPLADPDLAHTLANIILTRAKKHKKTKNALSNDD